MPLVSKASPSGSKVKVGAKHDDGGVKTVVNGYCWDVASPGTGPDDVVAILMKQRKDDVGSYTTIETQIGAVLTMDIATTRSPARVGWNISHDTRSYEPRAPRNLGPLHNVVITVHSCNRTGGQACLGQLYANARLQLCMKPRFGAAYSRLALRRPWTIPPHL